MAFLVGSPSKPTSNHSHKHLHTPDYGVIEFHDDVIEFEYDVIEFQYGVIEFEYSAVRTV